MSQKAELAWFVRRTKKVERVAVGWRHDILRGFLERIGFQILHDASQGQVLSCWRSTRIQGHGRPRFFAGQQQFQCLLASLTSLHMGRDLLIGRLLVHEGAKASWTWTGGPKKCFP